MATADPTLPELERQRANRARAVDRSRIGNLVDARRLNPNLGTDKPVRKTRSLVPTQYERQGEALQAKLAEQQRIESERQAHQDEVVKRLLRQNVARVDDSRLPEAAEPFIDEENLSEEELTTLETERQNQTPRRSVGREVAGAATDQLKQVAADKAKQVAQKQAGKALEKVVGSLGPYGRAAVIAYEAVKNRKKIIAGVLIILAVVAIIIFGVIALIMFAFNSNPQFQGGSEPQPISTSNTVQQSQIQKLVNGSTITMAEAQTLKTEIDGLVTRAGTNSEALAKAQAMQAAIQAIIDDNGKDATVTSANMAIIRSNYEEFNGLISSSTSCNGAPTCLNVPVVAQSGAFRCQQAATLAVIMFYTGDASAFARANVLRDSAGRYYDKPNGQECFFDLTHLNREGGSVGRGDWIKLGYKEVADRSGITARDAKSKVLDYTIASLQRGDPVIGYFTDGGITGLRHIVAIVGYSASENADQGGTFYVHNAVRPKNGVVRAYAYASKSSRYTYTKNHFINTIGGDGGQDWDKSVVIRRVYTQ